MKKEKTKTIRPNYFRRRAAASFRYRPLPVRKSALTNAGRPRPHGPTRVGEWLAGHRQFQGDVGASGARMVRAAGPLLPPQREGGRADA
jgi:hypothetical protein